MQFSVYFFYIITSVLHTGMQRILPGKYLEICSLSGLSSKERNVQHFVEYYSKSSVIEKQGIVHALSDLAPSIFYYGLHDKKSMYCI